MRVVRLDTPLEGNGATVVSVGNFDGVHRGHQTLVGSLVVRARERGVPSVVMTFVPHTRAVLIPENPQPVLTTCEEKACLLGSMGVDVLACLPFDLAVSRLSPEKFIGDILVGRLRAGEWVMGANHAFGRGRQGTRESLRAGTGINHISMFPVDLLAGEGVPISSTRIREEIRGCRIESAVAMLGHPYLILARRVRGVGTGSKLGYATLNFRQPPGDKVAPPPGVYAAELEHEGGRWQGALYFGNCPTFENRDYHFEFHAFKPTGKFPVEGQEAALWVHRFIRGDIAFAEPAGLVEQIARDTTIIKAFFS